MSLPRLPLKVSLPGPPTRRSLPAPPFSVFPAVPAFSVSPPPPAFSVAVCVQLDASMTCAEEPVLVSVAAVTPVRPNSRTDGTWSLVSSNVRSPSRVARRVTVVPALL